ncbi:hypothetical protein EVJ58_g473 [Rhodofomes roseus]|uniref:DUF6534 domain-containing protein n=1 Tax=Rhodofomes roseus TaxID=34475 RepID=A0A4Y9Z4C6_9APHY|nr:hypothetical protein EVJ58_g473 [Rhodofomes roseus]
MGPAIQYSFAATVGASYVGLAKRSPMLSQVAFLWVLDTIHLAFIGHAVYTYVITDFGDMDAIAQPLCERESLLENSYSEPSFPCGLRQWFRSPAEAFSVWGFLVKGYAFEQREISQIFLYTNLSSSVVADILIATYMWWILRQSRTGIANTDYILGRLTIYSISIGLLTCFCTLLCIILYALLPPSRKFAFVAVYFILPKLLLNSMLATLNVRQCTKTAAPNEFTVTTATHRELGTPNGPFSTVVEVLHRRRESLSRTHVDADYPHGAEVDQQEMSTEGHQVLWAV